MMKNFLPKILITGANGQLGTMLIHRAPHDEFNLLPCGRAELDITNQQNVMDYFAKHQPAIVINTAAYTAVDKAEDEIDQAMQINAHGAEKVAKACAAMNIKLIHISTDYVFAGTSHKAMHEDDKPHPLNVYGQSKLLGEQAVMAYAQQHIILRICAVYSEFGNNFYKTIRRLAKERKELRIVSDQIACPTYAGDIADAIYQMARQLTHFGIYHFCSNHETSWHHFASAIVNHAAKNEKLLVEQMTAISTAEFGARAARPYFSILDCSKIARDYGISQPDWNNHLCL